MLPLIEGSCEPQTQYKVAMAEALVMSTLQQARDDGTGNLGYAM